jgi:hypothetical protein
MNWYDWITLVTMVLVTSIQTVRGIRAGGMGLPLFEALGVVVSAAAATFFARMLAGSIQARESTVMLALFLVFSLLALFVARWLFALTALSLQSLDGIFSVLCGLVMAWAIAHMFLRVMIGSEGGETAEAIANSPVAREVYQFRTWNALMRLLFKAQAVPDFDPTEG